MNSHPPTGHLQLYFDHRLPDNEMQSVEHHLHLCPVCSTTFKELISVRESVSRVADVELSYGFEFRLRRAIQQEGSHELLWGGVESVARNAVTAIAVLVLCVVVFSTFDAVAQDLPNEPIIVAGQLDTLSNHLFNKQSEISRDDLVYAVVSR